MPPKQPLGVTLIVPVGREATGVYTDPNGVEVFTTDTPYTLSDGVSLQPPLPVFDAGGPTFSDIMGNMQAALAVSGLTPPPAIIWQTITLTAGDEGQWVGFSDGGANRPQPAFGSIDAQPTATTELLALYDDTVSDVYLVVFAGDYVAEMTGLTLSIGGFPFEPFEIELISGNTWLRYNGTGDLLTGNAYQIDFA